MDLRIPLSKERFESLSGFELSQELINLPILQVRGQPLEQKRDVYAQLTPGQKALFAFWVLYGHTKMGWLQFYLEGLYVGGYDQFLPMMKAGLQHVQAQALLANIAEAETLYATHKEHLQTIQHASDKHGAEQVEFDAIHQEFVRIDERLFPLLKETMAQIEAYIRATPEEFVIFT